MYRLDEVRLAVAVRALEQGDARIQTQFYCRVVAEAGEVELTDADGTASQSQWYTNDLQ